MNRVLVVCAAIALVGLEVEFALAQRHYEFTRIADETGMFSFIFDQPSISADGAVAFRAGLDGGGRGIFVGHGGPTTTIVDTSGSVSLLGDPAISAGGAIAYWASFDGGGHGIFTSSGGSTTPIAQSGGPFSGLGLYPAINASGSAAFLATLGAGGAGIFIGNGGPATAVVDTSGPFTSLGNPSINDVGTVAFTAYLDNGEEGIFAKSAGSTVTIAHSSAPFYGLHTANFTRPQINASGTVAFIAYNANGKGVFLGNGGPIATIADDSGPLADFGRIVSINAAGEIAFWGAFDSGGQGIFTDSDLVAGKVIRTGDPLFGSTLVALDPDPVISNNGDIAFRYTLANGVEGIAVARVVPEPGSAVIGAMAAAALFARRSMAR